MSICSKMFLMGEKAKVILGMVLGWRIYLFVLGLISTLFIVQRTGYLGVNPWANFDGVHYLSIAQNGYVSEAVFFPLYPLLIKLFGMILGGNYFWASLVVSNSALLLAVILFYKLIKLDSDAKRGTEAVLWLLLFPTVFFFSAAYSESLFLLLLVASFYFARKKYWGLAMTSAFFLCITRVVGVFIIPALIYEYFRENRNITWRFLAVPLGLVGYALFNLYKWGDFLYFIRAHSELNNGRSVSSIILFPQTIYRYIKILFSLPINVYEWQIALLEVAMFLLVSYLLYSAWRNKVRLSYLIFSVFAFLMPASSGTFSGLPRYVIILFPIYLALTYQPMIVKRLWAVISFALLSLLTMFFLRGYFVA